MPVAIPNYWPWFLEKATGKRLVEYLVKCLGALGAEHEAFVAKWIARKATWWLLRLASNTRDLHASGKLYKDHGRWNGKQLLDSSFIAKSVTPRFRKAPIRIRVVAL